MSCGLWVISYGLSVVGYELWLMSCGLWVMSYEFLTPNS